MRQFMNSLNKNDENKGYPYEMQSLFLNAILNFCRFCMCVCVYHMTHKILNFKNRPEYKKCRTSIILVF